MRALALLTVITVILSSCASPPKSTMTCAAPVPIPAPRGKHEAIGRFEIRVELWAEKLLARGNDCAAALAKVQKK
jgi:hypothetical protein